jgi:hypothetical protein
MGSFWDQHFHSVWETNFLLEGKLKINDIEIIAGQIFVVEPYEIVKPEFIEDCSVFVIKSPSKLFDKHIL